MKLYVCIVVFNRIENIKKWIHAWKQCEQHEAELIIIHNYYGNKSELIKFKRLCNKNKIRYIPRNSQGFDIGAFQDICRDRLPDFPDDWTHLLWCCDDTLPVSKDFLKPFIDHYQTGVGVVCMQISPEVRPHIRTTGFMISKEVASKLTFPADPVITKEHCYQFEHRTVNNFYKQVMSMGLKVVQAAPNVQSPLWDSGYTKRLPREREYARIFDPVDEKILFICPIFDAFPQIISSLICQTYKNWELLLIHDGTNDLNKLIAGYGDKRIKYIKQPRAEKWGHPLRQWALNEIKAGKLGKDADYVVITNGDNYYMPPFCDYMLKGFTNGQVAVYCDQMVHSYKAWNLISCRLQLGYIDCGGVMVKKDVAVETGWRDVDSHSSDWTYFSDIIKKHGVQKWGKVRGTLFVHN